MNADFTFTAPVGPPQSVHIETLGPDQLLATWKVLLYKYRVLFEIKIYLRFCTYLGISSENVDCTSTLQPHSPKSITDLLLRHDGPWPVQGGEGDKNSGRKVLVLVARRGVAA